MFQDIQQLITNLQSGYRREVEVEVLQKCVAFISGSHILWTVPNREGRKNQNLEFQLALGVFPFSYTWINTMYIFVVLRDWLVLALECHFEPKYTKDFQNL